MRLQFINVYRIECIPLYQGNEITYHKWYIQKNISDLVENIVHTDILLTQMERHEMT